MLFGPVSLDLHALAIHLLLFAVVLALGWAVGRLVGYLLYRVTRGVGIERGFRRTALGQAILKSGYGAAEFVDLAGRGVVYAAAILLAFVSLEIPIVSNAVNGFLDYFPRLVVAAVILVVGFVLSDWFGEFMKGTLPPESRRMLSLDLVADLLKFVFYFITVILALRETGIDTTILYIFAQALAWSIAIAVGVAVGVIVGWTFRDRLRAPPA